MTDKLIIKDLVVECRLGTTEAERVTPQRVWIDLEVAIDAARAAAHDDLRDALDYASLVRRVSESAQARPVALLETLAETLANLVLREFAAPEVVVRVKKRALPGLDYAAVELVRRRSN